MSNVFHNGELEVQNKMNVQHIASKVGQSIKDRIILGAIPFIENQSTITISSKDSNHKNWISLLVGVNGFIHVPDVNTFDIYIDKLKSDLNDVFFKNITKHKTIGAIFIELGSKRRYRVNGTVILITENKISIKITEAYPNCPKYIQQRSITNLSPINTTPKKETGLNNISTKFIDLIKNADTFFIGSEAVNKMDASHRGGKPGFIKVINRNTLKIPEYVGNNLYNTLGNLTTNPNAGLMFIDFTNNSVLQLNGSVLIQYDQKTEEDLKQTNTGIFWTFNIEKWIFTENHHQMDWNFIEYSKFNY